jgi:hypothetical protein
MTSVRMTRHAGRRAKQRGVPPVVIDWLIGYGVTVFDGRGGVVRYFDRRAVRRLQRDYGRFLLRRMSEYLRCYMVESSADGIVITVGKRHRGARITRH